MLRPRKRGDPLHRFKRTGKDFLSGYPSTQVYSIYRRSYSTLTLHCRPTVLQLSQMPRAIYSSPDGSCVLISQEVDGERTMTSQWSRLASIIHSWTDDRISHYSWANRHRPKPKILPSFMGRPMPEWSGEISLRKGDCNKCCKIEPGD